MLVSNDWDSSYRRGLSYSQGECWEPAISQFLQAIDQRPYDQWRARVYGMHFLDEYFPHRELGIVYLQQGCLKEAIDELSLSLDSEDSAKAKYYLNKARKQWLKETGLDQTPPVIQFPERNDKLGQSIFTNCSTYHIKGQAIDDFFVSRILINDHPIFLDLAQPQISFQKRVILKPGFNLFHWKAMDLVDHECHEEIRIFLDQQGPTVFFSPAPDAGLWAAQISAKRRVKGLIFDAGGLARLIIGEEEIPLTQGEKMYEFEVEIPFLPRPTFEARDLAGNLTKGDLAWIWDDDKGKEMGYFHGLNSKFNISALLPNKGIKVCANSPFWPATASEKTILTLEKGPEIFIGDYPHVVFEPKVVIQGWIESTSEITDVWINDKSVLSARETSGLLPLLRRFMSGGRTIFYFTRLIEGLKEGNNRLTVTSEDKHGESVQKDIVVEYQVREIEKIGNRWCLAILPFLKNKIDQPILAVPPPSLMAFLDECLHLSFFQSQRFLLLERERIDEVMNELDLRSPSMVDMSTGPQLGKLLSAEVLLMGSIQEAWDGQDRCLGIIARLVEVETGQILAIKSVYNRWRTHQDEEYLLNGLAHKFKQEFPLLQGEVIDKSLRTFSINLGADDLIKQGMKVLVYRPGEKGHPIDKNHAEGKNQTVLGEARVEKVSKDSSLASPSLKRLLKMFEVGNFVITK